MSSEPTVCLFCAMPGASTQVTQYSVEPLAIHQYGCGTVQCIRHPSGEIVSSHQSPACRKIVALQERLHALEQEQSHA